MILTYFINDKDRFIIISFVGRIMLGIVIINILKQRVKDVFKLLFIPIFHPSIMKK